MEDLDQHNDGEGNGGPKEVLVVGESQGDPWNYDEGNGFRNKSAKVRSKGFF